MIRPSSLFFAFVLLPGVSLAQEPAPTPAVAETAALESPPVFNASEVLPPTLYAGLHHRVRDAAPSDGYLIHFTIDSRYGVFECVGVREVQRRVREIHAIASLVEEKSSSQFVKGVGQSVANPVGAATNVATQPVTTVSRVPHTVGHFFSKAGASAANVVRQPAKKSQKAGQTPYDAGGGSSPSSGVMKLAGIEKSRLAVSRQFGVDPYTDNERLRAEIDRVSKANLAGQLPLKVGSSFVLPGAGAGLLATEMVGVPGTIYEVTPGELAIRDRRTLREMGLENSLVESLMANQAIPISYRHLMVNTLNQLGPVPGRSHFVACLSTCQNYRQAHFLGEMILLLASRHRQVPYASFALHGNLPAGITRDGVLEVAAPVDYVTWTEGVAGFARRNDWGYDFKKRLLLFGSASERAVAAFQQTGWEVATVPQNAAR